jgi:hypothetical protein
MKSDTRTCRDCGHWQPAQQNDGIHGECCCDVPMWALELEFEGCPPWFTRADSPADSCDKFSQRNNG